MLDRIRNNVALKTGAFALSLIFAVLAVEAWRGFQQRSASLHQKFHEERVFLTSTTAHSLSLPLYEYDVDVIQNIVDALLDHQDVISVQVIEFNGTQLVETMEDTEAEETVTEQTEVLSPNNYVLGSLNVTFSNDRVLAELRSELMVALLRIGVILILMCGIIAWTIWSIVRPVTRLESAVRAYDGRNWPENVPGVNRKDEFGSLARSFQVMAVQLKSLFNDLERRVEERTEELEHALDQAEAASKAKSSFLANMSHEIRTPMNGVLGMAEQLMNTPLDERQKLFADTIYKSGNSLLVVINDILDFSKIESGKLELDPDPFNLRTALEDVATLLRMRAQEKDLEIILRIDPTLPEHFVGDVGRIRQVITNLVGNAIKFTEEGHVTLTVSGEPRGNGTILCRIEVADTGIGIPEDKVGEIFEEFAQAEQSTTRKFGGTGLGLAISRRLVELMGGELGVASTLGEGSTFCLELPLPVHGEARRLELSGERLAGSRVLIIDHPQQSLEVLEELCGYWGMEIDMTMSGDNGLRLIREAVEKREPYDVVLIGSYTPDKGAVEIVRSLRSNALLARTKVIVVPASDDDRYIGLLPELNVDSYVVKPVKAVILHRELERMVAGAAGASEGAEEDTGTQADEAASLAPVERRRLLVVEDNEVNRLVLDSILDKSLYDLTFAENGKIACDLSEQERFDAILMDLSMPVMDGYEATAGIRAHEGRTGRARTPIICLTAHAMKGQDQICRDHDMDDYLTKPVKQQDVMAMLRKWTDTEPPAEAKVANGR